MITLEERTIYLSWQATDHSKRYIVAELMEKSTGEYSFRYIPGHDLEEARRLGFNGYPAFPELDKEYSLNAIDPFVMRLPARSRADFIDLLNYWEIKNSDISDFDLLAITGGKLRTDNFEFIDPLVAVIELDDESHERETRKAADSKKNKALSDAGISIVRWQVKMLPDESKITASILPNAALKGDVPRAAHHLA